MIARVADAGIPQCTFLANVLCLPGEIPENRAEYHEGREIDPRDGVCDGGAVASGKEIPHHRMIARVAGTGIPQCTFLANISCLPGEIPENRAERFDTSTCVPSLIL